MMTSRKLPIWLAIGTVALMFSLGAGVRAQDDAANKAKTMFNQGVEASDPGEAEKFYKSAIAADPTFIDPYINLGALYFKQSKFDEAAGIFRDATEQDPDNAEAWANLGRVHYAVRKYDQAAEAYGKAIEHDPAQRDYYKEAALALFRGGEYAELISTLEAGHNLGHGTHLTHYLLGKAYEQENNDAKAIAAYKQSIAANDGYANAHFSLGQIYLSQNKYQSAASEFKKALNLDPRKVAAAYNYAVAIEYTDPENYDRNIAVWQDYINVAKKATDPRVKRNLATAEAHVKELKEAAEQAKLQ